MACTGSQSHTPPADLGPVTAVKGTILGACAVRLDGTVRCWGYAGYPLLDVPCGLGAVKDLFTSYYDVS